MYCILEPLATDVRGMRGGKAHTAVLNYLIGYPLERSKLYSPSEPRLLSLCRAASSEHNPLPHSSHSRTSYQPQRLQQQLRSALSTAATSACCYLLAQCLMSTHEACAEILPLCCEYLGQKVMLKHSKGPKWRPLGGHVPPHASTGFAQIPMNLQHYITASVMDSVNLHFEDLQLYKPNFVVKSAQSTSSAPLFVASYIPYIGARNMMHTPVEIITP